MQLGLFGHPIGLAERCGQLASAGKELYSASHPSPGLVTVPTRCHLSSQARSAGSAVAVGLTPRRLEPHTLSRSADGRSAAIASVLTCTVPPPADIHGRIRTWANETMNETNEDHSCYRAVSGASSGRAYANTSCTDGSIVRCLVDAKTAERSGESGEMIEPEEDP